MVKRLIEEPSRLSEDSSRDDVAVVRQIAAILADPFRMRLIIALSVEAPLGADTLAERTGEPIHRVRRHLNALLACGIVGIAGEEGRRNTTKRYFALDRRPWIGIEEDRLLGERDRRRHTVGTIRVIFEEATRAASNAQLVQRADRLVANFPGRVDEQGWGELSVLHHEMLNRVQRVMAESRVRLARGDEEPIGVISQQVLLEAPQHSPKASA